MGTRPVERDPRQDLPAPGDYQPEGAPGSPSGPAYTMRGRPLEERAPDSPGVCAAVCWEYRTAGVLALHG